MTPHSVTYLTIRAALRFLILGAAAYLFGTWVQALIQGAAGAWIVFGLGALLFGLVTANWITDARAERD